MTTPSEQEAQWLKLGHEDEILAAFTASTPVPAERSE